MKYVPFAPLLLSALVLATACQPLEEPRVSSRVGAGLVYSTGQATFDAFFSDLHRLQVLFARAPEEERSIREELGRSLAIDETTANQLTDELSRRVAGLAGTGVELRLVLEGFEARSEADTSAQARVIGTLPTELRGPVEAGTLAARRALRLAARLRGEAQTLEQLATRAHTLELDLEASFAGQPAERRAEIRTNLADGRRVIPLLDTRRRELRELSLRFAERLRVALTTGGGSSLADPAPLITETPLAPAATSSAPTNPKRSAAPPSKRPSAPPTPTSAAPPPSPPRPSRPADFEP
jgi:hypothetical protein